MTRKRSQDNPNKVSQLELESDERSPKRPPRVPMSAGKKLDYRNVEEGWHYRWVQDRDGRLDQAKAAYYEFVEEDGNKVVRQSGPHPLFLMRIEQRYYDEDQALKLQAARDRLKSEQTLDDGEYIPDGKSHVLEKDDYDPLG